MNTSSNGYVLGFAVAICVVMSAALALTANALKSAQDAAAEFDRQKNVMLAAGLVTPDDTRSRAELQQLYENNVVEQVLVVATGEPASDKTPKDVSLMKPRERALYRVVATTKGADGRIESYVLPISGKGLWSTLYGYLALDADGNRVRGITFYKHGETPGLGGECENPKWTAKWQGKHILDEQGKLVSVTIKKGVVDPQVAKEKAHYVDGLSGATITCNGINKFVKSDLESYRPLLGKIWNK